MYTTSITQHLTHLQDELYNEMISSMKETDYSMPRPHGRYYYYSRTFEGEAYEVYCRAPRYTNSSYGGEDDSLTIDWDGTKESPILPGEVVYLNVNELAVNQSQCDVNLVLTSPSHELVAYTVDYSGSEEYEVHVRNVTTGEDVVLKKSRESSSNSDEPLKIDDLEWGKDDDTMYYTTLDETNRPYQLYVRQNWKSQHDFTYCSRRRLIHCSRATSRNHSTIGTCFMELGSKETLPRFGYIDLSASSNAGEGGSIDMQCVAPRRSNVLYYVESHDDQWYITTNVGDSMNMKLMVSPATPDSADEWESVEDENGNPLFRYHSRD